MRQDKVQVNNSTPVPPLELYKIPFVHEIKIKRKSRIRTRTSLKFALENDRMIMLENVPSLRLMSKLQIPEITQLPKA